MDRRDKVPPSDTTPTNDEETTTGSSGAGQPIWAQAWGNRAPESLASPLAGLPALDDVVSGLPNIDSLRASITLDGFASDSAILTKEHQDALADYRKRVERLLAYYPDSFITIVGHTDATDSEMHNEALGQSRADAVLEALATGDPAVPRDIMTASSLGETALKIDTPGREPRNRRVEIYFRARRRHDLKLLDPAPPPKLFPSDTPYVKPPITLFPPGAGSEGPGPQVDPTPELPNWMWKKLPEPFKERQPGSFQHVFRDGFDKVWRDITKLAPKGRVRDWLRDKGPNIADKIFDSVVDSALGGDNRFDAETRDAMKNALKSLYRTDWSATSPPERPLPPLNEPPGSKAPSSSPMPGEKIFKLPPIRF